ncbi:MAG TPA: hypothetical protein VKX16_06345 [Chloroflexota bacterium]|nr:hypothetical protein [Chloroflexota bacterium]
MRHLHDGVLRRMLDEPLAISDSEREHYRTCAHCRERFGTVSAAARQARGALETPLPSLNEAGALALTKQRLASGGITPRRRFIPYSWRRLRNPLAGGAAALALLGAMALTPAGSLAQQVITVFQPSRVVAVQVTATDIHALLGLQKYGTFHLPRTTPSGEASSAAAASRLAGMHVLTPSSLPAGVPAEVKYGVTFPTNGSFTFSAARAKAAAAAEGKQIPPMPAHIDGSTLQINVPSGVLTLYGASQGDIPALVIGQVGAPTVRSSGVTAQQLESYLLSMPNISPALAAQIRAIGDPTKVLPIPVPMSLVNAQKVRVQGVEGLAIGDQTGVGSGVLWEKQGVIYAVGGSLPESEILAIANSLR